MSVGVIRYVEVLAEHGLRPFPEIGRTRLLRGEPPPFRWRVSPDERRRLILEVTNVGAVSLGIELTDPDGPAKGAEILLGLPLVVDDVLPPNSVILEPLP